MWSLIASKFMYFLTMFVVFFETIFGINVAPAKKDYQPVKNVIFMIGDGMGFNSIEKTKAENGIDALNFDRFPLKGASETRSYSDTVTDSAAGGTALACATRVTNDTVGVYHYDKNAVYSYPKSLTELAVEYGKMTGVITSDSTSGATPATFSVHTSARGNEEDITAQQLASDFDLIWGTATASFSETTAKANGFEVVYNKADMDALTEGTRSFAQFTSPVWYETPGNGMPTMAEMTAKAIDLLDDTDEGFFLMVEGAHIDKNNHSNDGEHMKEALTAFDKAVGVALDYAEANPGTLVVVTADHETGGITLKNGEYVYTKTGHSDADVPALVYGSNIIENGETLKNRELSQRVAESMGSKEFPARVLADPNDTKC